MRDAHPRSRVPVVAVLAALLLIPACGKKGPPLPPAPRGPFAPTLVEARQVGTRVLVSFVVPPPRSANAASTVVRAELLRVSFSPGGAPAPDPDAFRRRGEIVATRQGVPFEGNTTLRLTDGSAPSDGFAEGTTLRYGVRLFDQRGRNSPLALAPDLVVAEVVPGPTGLRAEPTADGVRLSWDALPDTLYDIYRADPGRDMPLRPLNERPSARGEYLDATAPPGSRLVYTVRVVIGEPPPYVEGEDATPVEIEVLDRFAPAAPQGLVAVQEGPAVRLFWDPSSERDLAGYRVYRQDGPDSPWVGIGPEAIDRPLFLDETAPQGSVVGYRITAIDRATPPNESEPSGTVRIEVEERAP